MNAQIGTYRIVHDAEACVLCGACIQACPADALKPAPPKGIAHSPEVCRRCGVCIRACPVGALSVKTDS